MLTVRKGTTEAARIINAFFPYFGDVKKTAHKKRKSGIKKLPHRKEEYRKTPGMESMCIISATGDLSTAMN